jgi:hypothetical protein
MNFVLQPWQLLVAILAGWVNRQQQAVIDFQRTEMQILREHVGKKRILLNDDQRRRLAVKGKVLGRKLLEEVGSSFTPDTILRWHRQLVAEKWNYSERRSKQGRPPLKPSIGLAPSMGTKPLCSRTKLHPLCLLRRADRPTTSRCLRGLPVQCRHLVLRSRHLVLRSRRLGHEGNELQRHFSGGCRSAR